MFLINGYLKNYLDANDRATQFGDGIFTTALIIDGKVILHTQHLFRLQEACKKLFIPFNKWNILRKEMCTVSKYVRRGVLKVIISRGSGGVGYGTNSCCRPNRILSVSQYPHYYDSWRSSGITLTLSPIRIGRNTTLAGIKHLNKLEQVMIRAYLERSKINAEEAIVLDSEGIIRECCSSNLFWRYGHNVFTPRLNQAGVNGIMRQFFFMKLMHSPFRILEVDEENLQVLLNADEVLVCNALMPILAVRAYKKKIWTSRKLYRFLVSFCNFFK